MYIYIYIDMFIEECFFIDTWRGWAELAVSHGDIRTLYIYQYTVLILISSIFGFG